MRRHSGDLALAGFVTVVILVSALWASFLVWCIYTVVSWLVTK